MKTSLTLSKQSLLPSQRKILENAVRERKGPGFEIEKFCFDKQIGFIDDPHPFTTAVCSVRAGKTVACAADLIRTALGRKGVACLYITLSRINAKRIIWPELCSINTSFALGGKVNESELSIKFQNGSVIYVSGAKDKREIEKFRGLALALCYIDECQSFRGYIRELVEEVIAKRLFDYAGKLRLIGTPGPVPVGYFYECSKSKEWSHHAWTMFDNPWLPKKSGNTHEEILQRELKRKGVERTDPSIQRECFGIWAFDPNALVFRYNEALNHYEQLPKSSTWNHIIGVDLGYDDADAIAVLAYSPDYPDCYLVYEDVTHKQGIDGLSAKINELIKTYSPDRIVMDTGGLGKKIAESIQQRYSIPILAAEKSRKFEYIELLNDSMRTKRFYASKRSRFAADCFLVEWDRDVVEKYKIKDTYHSDICDAVLYAFREAFHWLYEKPEVRVAIGSAAWLQEQEKEMEQAAMIQHRRSKEIEIWADFETQEEQF